MFLPFSLPLLFFVKLEFEFDGSVLNSKRAG
jgi:hypothetical protein